MIVAPKALAVWAGGPGMLRTISCSCRSQAGHCQADFASTSSTRNRRKQLWQ
jgi:hypothetical protein